MVTSQSLPNNEWFEYDDGNQAYTAQGIDNQAIQAIIDSQPSTSQDKPKVTVQRWYILVDIANDKEPMINLLFTKPYQRL